MWADLDLLFICASGETRRLSVKASKNVVKFNPLHPTKVVGEVGSLSNVLLTAALSKQWVKYSDRLRD